MNFRNQAALCYKIRNKHGYTQKDLALIMDLGDAGAQQISNIERAVCGFPLKRIKRLLSLVSKDALTKAIVSDLVEQINESTK